MRALFITSIALCLFCNYASGQNDKEYKRVIIHKQFGDTITESELYNYMGFGASLYMFKISGDTIYTYLDEDPPETRYAAIDSISDGTLDRPANLDDIQDINGKTYTKDKLSNNVVVMNFWGTWCSPCIEEIPELNRLVESYANKEVLFFAPTIENGQRLDDFLSRIEFKYNIVPQAGELTDSFKTFAFPTHVVIDRQGIVKFVQVGTDPETIHEVLSSEIEKCL
jgi:thiol-disulfide isomerase/thioredoxin